MNEPTTQLCDQAPHGETHHLVPRAAGQTCVWCHKTEAELRAAMEEGS